MPDDDKPKLDRPKGKPLSDEEALDGWEITDEDIADAAEAWRRDAPPRYRELLDASEEVEE